MADKKKKLLLVDGMALAYRGHFAMMRNPRLTSKGINTSSVFVFLNVVLDLLKQEQPDYAAVAFDTPEPTFRHKEFPEYKAQREAMPEDLAAAIPWIDEVCEAFRIPRLRLPGWEADDIIGTLSKQADEAGIQTLMVTPDKDYAQLVSEHALLYKPAKGGGFDVLGVAEVCEQWGIERVDQVIDILGLMGDSSDNIPGIPGIGQKTAQKLIAQYDSMENLLDHIDEQKGKRKENLEQFAEQGLLSKKLVIIDRDAPVETSVADLVVGERDDLAVKEVFYELEFRTIAKRLFGKDYELGDDVEAGESGSEPATLADTFHDYRCVDDAEGRAALVAELAGLDEVCFDLETTGLDARHCQIIGVAWSWQAQSAVYVPVPADPEAAQAVLEEFTPIWTDPGIAKIGHNLKFDAKVLRAAGIRLRGRILDTMLAAFLALPEQKRNMDALALELLDYRCIGITELIGEKGDEQKSLREVPLAQVVDYACEDADITWQLAERLRQEIDEQGQTRVWIDIEGGLIPVLVEMEHHGIHLDIDGLAALSTRLDEQIASDRDRIWELAGEEFNLNSPKQLGTILFDKLALSAFAQKTKTGQYKTDEHVLTRLAAQHEIAQVLLNYRMRSKLKSTYVDSLPGTVDASTGCIHTHYEQAAAATGRLASHAPNLQNIPIRSEQGREIRAAFTARSDEYVLFAADYSQVELRIAASMSGDRNMQAAFIDGLDIHTATAMLLNGVDADGVTAEMRRRAKTVNFGILYGITPFGLAERMGIPRGEGKDLIDSYFASFPKIKAWQEEIIAVAHDTGYVETLTGRRRYLRDIHSRNGNIRKGAERVAVNAPVQGTAADLIKLAMIRIDELLREGGYRSRMLLQVHDELVFELQRDEADELVPRITEAMQGALPMAVPLAVDVGLGDNWLVAH